jgi:hypothetical protein
MEYYSLAPILSRGAPMMVIIGRRGAGKTFSWKKWAYEDWKKNGNCWIYLRRYSDEISIVKQTFWDDLLPEEGMVTRTVKNECQIREEQPEGLKGKELKEWNELHPWKSFGFYISLNQQQSFKGSPFPNVTKICFDEFIIENKAQHYINGRQEPDQLLSIMETTFRKRKVKLVLFSNAGFLDNPYFPKYNIKAKDFEGARFVKRNQGAVIFEYYTPTEETIEHQKQTDAYKISTDSYISYAYDNKFKDGTEAMIDKKPSGAEPWVKLTVDGKTWLTIYTLPGSKWWIGETNPDISQAYSLNRFQPIEGTVYDPKVLSNLREQFDNRKMNFDSPDVLVMFLDWIRG